MSPAPHTLALVLAAAVLAACSGPQSEVGRTGIMASSSLGTLEATLPPSIPVLTISAAAERALRARGFTITEKTASEDRAHIEAQQRSPGVLESVSVWVSTLAAGPGLRVRVEPLGDEARSRVVMEGILTELGLARR
ncbi:MAG: hypothetical protein ACKVS8_07025 [Phycisphaerales bacterium]